MRFLPDRESSHPLLVPVLLIAAVLCVYYPAMLSGVHSIDDPGILSQYAVSPPLSRILLPGASYYYRPVIELSFWLDQRLWGLEPAVMHLENILLHAGNTLLVYLLALSALGKVDSDREGWAFFTALVFALHPLNVEPVAWIAGRTDPLLALFSLSGCLFLTKWLDESRPRYAVSASLLFLLAFLTKETAVALLPVAMLLILLWPGRDRSLSRETRLKVVGVLALAALAVGVSALALRENLMALGRLLAPETITFPQAAMKLVTALGFYLRKAFAPFPLKFAITEVSPMHALVALSGALALVASLRRRHLFALFFTAALLLITPALLVALRNISWTPYAERYMYLPTAFISLGVGTAIVSLPQQTRLRLVPALMLIIVVAGVSSRQRAVLWQNKMAFYQDAVAKSPGFGSLYNELGGIYLQQNRFDDAVRAFERAERLNTRPAMVSLVKSNIMRTLVARRDYARARVYFETAFPVKEDAPVVFLESLQKADGNRLALLAGEERVRLSTDLLETFDVLYRKTKDPFWLYRSAMLARDRKSYSQALKLFRRAYTEAPADASYRLAAGKQIASMEGVQ